MALSGVLRANHGDYLPGGLHADQSALGDTGSDTVGLNVTRETNAEIAILFS